MLTAFGEHTMTAQAQNRMLGATGVTVSLLIVSMAIYMIVTGTKNENQRKIMEHNNQAHKSFTYTYSAREQAELKRIREKYTATTGSEDKMSRLHRLDASVTNTAQAFSLICGVLGTLILGFGMSLCMTDLREVFGMTQVLAMVTGIVGGVIGGVLASLAYPVYRILERRMRKKVAPEILRLTDELMR